MRPNVVIFRALFRHWLHCTALIAVLLPSCVRAQLPGGSVSSSSSSSSSGSSQTPQNPAGPASVGKDQMNPDNRPQAARVERGGASITLEYNEPLFQMAAGLNACGYDRDLENSAKVRLEVRQELNDALAASEEARASRDKLCQYITEHRLNDGALDIGQYISLALYLSPPPDLEPNVDETQLPPQAEAVVNVLGPLRAFAEATQLHLMFIRHRPEYEALTERVHDPMTRMILDTNVYLHQPVSTYDGRRFLVLLEPMLSPALTNARIYGSDYIIVMSPDNRAEGDPVRMDVIRHTYLHYIVEPLVYSRGSAMERIQPLLRGVSDAPLEFTYKSDVVALITECMIKAIEAHMLVIVSPVPKRPGVNRSRAEAELYDEQMTVYRRETAAEQAKLVDLDEHQGWVLTGYFYRTLDNMEHEGGSLRDQIAPMIYGMDVDRERKHAETILFSKEASVDPLGRSATVRSSRPADPMDEAERDLMAGKSAEAEDIALKAMSDPKGDHGRAQYLLARLDLMQGQPQKAMDGFQATLKLTSDPRTIAWSHIYLGRLYDVQPDRERAMAEYAEALAHRDARPDTRQAAEAGLKKPFALPKRAGAPKPDDDSDLDPTGKAQKEAYKPEAPAAAQPK